MPMRGGPNCLRPLLASVLACVLVPAQGSQEEFS